MRRLYIAAKAPRPGFVKTRLARSVGDAAAAALYTGFLRDLNARFLSERVEPTWFVTPDGAWPEIAAATGIAGSPPVVDQGAGDWGERQDRLFSSAAARGESPVVLIASDSPQISVAYVQEAFDLLADHDLVVGPVRDGGYCLIGMRGYHRGLLDLPMSKPDVFDSIRSRAGAGNLRLALLHSTFDIDEIADLEALRAECLQRADLVETGLALALISQREMGHRLPLQPRVS